MRWATSEAASRRRALDNAERRDERRNCVVGSAAPPHLGAYGGGERGTAEPRGDQRGRLAPREPAGCAVPGRSSLVSARMDKIQTTPG